MDVRLQIPEIRLSLMFLMYWSTTNTFMIALDCPGVSSRKTSLQNTKRRASV
jgi:hypothetical protein